MYIHSHYRQFIDANQPPMLVFRVYTLCTQRAVEGIECTNPGGVRQHKAPCSLTGHAKNKTSPCVENTLGVCVYMCFN